MRKASAWKWAIMLTLMLTFGVAANLMAADSPYAKMKEGDWVMYKFGGTVQTVVLEKLKGDNAEVKLTVRLGDIKYVPFAEYTQTVATTGKDNEVAPAPYWVDMGEIRLCPTGKDVTKGAEEEIEVAGKKYKCTVYEWKHPQGALIKNWISPDGPFDGIVKITAVVPNGEQQLLSIEKMGSKADAIPGGKEVAKTKQYSPDAPAKVFNKEQLGAFLKVSMEFNQMGQKAENAIVDTRKMAIVSFDDIIKEAEKKRLILVGESHDSVQCHTMQLDVIKALFKKNPKLAIGLEMFVWSEEMEKNLNDYVAGNLDENTFRAKCYNPCWSAEWYPLLKPIFDYAKENKIPLVALNCPGGPGKPEEATALRKKFIADPNSLTPEERKLFPDEVDLTDPQHTKITMWNFKAMADMGMPVESMVKGQALWDDAMSDRAVKYLAKDKESQMVVLVGCLHVSYRLTIPERAVKKAKKAGFNLDYVVLFPHNLAMGGPLFEEFLRLDITDYVYYYYTQMKQQGGGGRNLPVGGGRRAPRMGEKKAAEGGQGGGAIGDWMQAHAAMMKGEFEAAAKFLRTDDNPMSAKLLGKAEAFMKIDNLIKEGKKDEAKKEIDTLKQDPNIGRYGQAIKILEDRLNK